MILLINILMLVFCSCSKAGFKNNIKMDEVASKGPEGYTGTDAEIRKQISRDIYDLPNDPIHSSKEMEIVDRLTCMPRKFMTMYTTYKNGKGEEKEGYIPLYEAVLRKKILATGILFVKYIDQNFDLKNEKYITRKGKESFSSYLKVKLFKDVEFRKEMFKRVIDTSNIHLIKFLLEEEIVDINEDFDDNFFPLIHAIGVLEQKNNSNSREMLNFILSFEKTDINKVNSRGSNTLIFALFNKMFKSVDILLDHKVDLSYGDPEKKPVLFLLIEDKIEDAINYLISKCPNILEDSNSEGCTPLIYAIKYGNKSVFNIILENDINIDMQTKNGDTALITSIKEGNLITMIKLLEKGAKIDISNKNRQTALSIAKRKRDKKKEDSVDYRIYNIMVTTLEEKLKEKSS